MDAIRVQAGESVSVRPGEPVALEIPGASMTGHLWSMTADPKSLELLDHHVVPNEESFGGSGLERFIVKPLRSGGATVRFELKAPWDEQPAKTLSLTLQAG